MIFHIAVCSPDSVLRSRVERRVSTIMPGGTTPASSSSWTARRPCWPGTTPGSGTSCTSLSCRPRQPPRRCGQRLHSAAGGGAARWLFLAHTPAHAYSAYRVDAMQYLLLPVPPEQLDALLARATEPEYGPAIPVATASGLRVLPFADIEYLECTHHVVHFHLASGEDVPSLSVRVPFAQVAQPLLADERFVQLHRSYVVNLAAVSQLAAGEFWMQSGARVPVPRGREPAARTALKDYLEKQFR